MVGFYRHGFMVMHSSLTGFHVSCEVSGDNPVNVSWYCLFYLPIFGVLHVSIHCPNSSWVITVCSTQNYELMYWQIKYKLPTKHDKFVFFFFFFSVFLVLINILFETKKKWEKGEERKEGWSNLFRQASHMIKVKLCWFGLLGSFC
jgi:TRAP-type mannitol/chloroaromatic compound transport system permease small subunit